MFEMNETTENSIYAIISLSKSFINSLENNMEQKMFIGLNGTCFFISPNKFVTAYHCLNKTFAKDQIYFLINKKGHIINGVNIEFEDSNSDLCIGNIDTSIDTYCKISTQSLPLIPGQKYTAYGFSSNETENVLIKIIKEENKIRIIEHDPFVLKKTEYNYIKHELLEYHESNDLDPIVLRDCNVHLFDKSVELGFSGGPTFNNTTNEVIGFASQDLFLVNFNVMIIISLTQKTLELEK